MKPLVYPYALIQYASVSASGVAIVRLTVSKCIAVQGIARLQFMLIASGVLEVPWKLAYVTLLTRTAVDCNEGRKFAAT